MATELEIKLSVSPLAQERAVRWLLECPGVRAGETRALVNRYFDTADGALNRARAALRVRKAGDGYLQTLKTRGEFVDGAHAREEWEWPLTGPELDLSLLAETPLSQALNPADLQVVFETNFQRQVLWQEVRGSVIEVAVDSGDIVAGPARCPLHEIEFELKSGDGKSLLDAAQALAVEVPVLLNLVSKAEQGYWLAGIYCPEAPRPGAALSVTDYLRMLGHAWLLDSSLSVRDEDLFPVARVADAVHCRELWEQVNGSLLRGIRVRELADCSTQLGRLQLKLAAAGQG